MIKIIRSTKANRINFTNKRDSRELRFIFFCRYGNTILVAPNVKNYNGLGFQNFASSGTYKENGLLYISTINARFFDHCGFLFEMITDTLISCETQGSVQKSIVMKKQAMFSLETAI